MTGGVLALDLATTLGWAYASFDVVRTWPRGLAPPLQVERIPGVVYGEQRLVPSGASNGDVGAKFFRWLDDQRVLFKVHTMVIEAPLPGGQRDVASAMRLFGLAFAAETYATQQGWRFATAHNATVKRFMTGSGRAEKSDVIAACIAMGWHPPSDNAADALGVLAWFISGRTR